ncbi:MAG: PilZ domain-containing protein, partial [Candidatus Krumholzibacteria bacterium]|nr:PilZ domain-containing protein [Candidatus Krumholzibacteria bacterium]
TMSYIPVVVNGSAPSSYGVIRNISGSGLLLESRKMLEPGDMVSVKAVIGQKLVPLDGTVAHVVALDESDFPEYLLGVKLDEPNSYRVSYVQWIADHMEALLFGRSAKQVRSRWPETTGSEDELLEE